MKRKVLALMCLMLVLALGTLGGCGDNKEADVPANKQTSKDRDDLNEEDDTDDEDNEVEKDKNTESDQNEEDTKEESDIKNEDAEDNTDDDTDQDENVETQQAPFTITEKTYEDGETHIVYPYIENLANQQITDFYNKEFESCINIYAGEAEEGDLEGTSQRTEQTYTVAYQSEDMISILIEGNSYSEGAAHPYSYKQTYNINLKTGESMGVTDNFTPQEITDDILAFRNIAVTGEIEEEYIKQELELKGKEGILDQLSQCDFEFTVGKDGEIEKSENIPYSYSYRQEDGKWMIVLEGSHAVGDYFTLRYEK